MITYINAANSQKYSILFEKATASLQKLHEDDVDYNADDYVIGSLEEYYANLNDLLSLAQFAEDDDVSIVSETTTEYQKLHSLGRRYSMLPLEDSDEAVFAIDANARTITVPTAFRTNGIGIKDDQLAEILYFRVDRFFDITDLDSTDIYIQWKSPNGVIGISKPWVIDIYSDPKKIVFGWAISNEMTDKAGNLQFSVRFVKINSAKDGFTFSLSTQPQTVAVKASLDIDFLAYTAKVVDDIILYRVQNSNTFVTGRDLAEAPIFSLDLPVLADLDDNNKLVLQAQAYATDGGVISYTWNKVAIVEDTDEINANGQITNTLSYVKSSNAFGVEGKAYYIMVKGENDVELPKRVATAAEAVDESGTAVDVYEVFGTADVGSLDVPCGSYQVTATNAKTGKNVATTTSTICMVPQPTTPVIATDLPARVNLDEEDELSIIAQNNADQIVTIDEKPIGSKLGTLSYEWTKDGAIVADENDKVLPISEEGIYTVKVINTKNKAVASIDSEVNCRVAHAPVMPAYTVESENVYKMIFKINDDVKETLSVTGDIKDSDVLSFAINLTEPAIDEQFKGEDSFTYQWWESLDTDFDYDESTDPKDDVKIEGATESVYTVNASDLSSGGHRFYCVATYVKNGITATGHSQVALILK